MTDTASRSKHDATTTKDSGDLRGSAPRVPVPRLLLLSLPLNLLALAGGCWMFVNAFILLDETAPMALIGISLINTVVLVVLARRIVKMRVVEQQRKFSRVALELDGFIDELPCRVTELSLGGCQVVLDAPSAIQAGQEVQVSFRLAGISFELESLVRGTGVAHTGKQLVRIGFQPGQNGYIERLAVGLLADNDAAWAA